MTYENQILDLEARCRNAEQEYGEQSELEWALKDILREYKGPDEVIRFKDFKMEDNKKHYIPSGIVELDKIIGGFGKGDIILITGDTGDGKSTFSRFLLKKLAEQEKKSLVFSYEESNFEYLSKFRGELPEGFMPKVVADKSPVWIERKIVEGIAKFKIECVFIDNLKGIIDYGSPKPLTAEIDFTIQKLKEIAMKYNIVLFLVAHIKKEEGKAIDKNSVKDSKTIVDTSSIGIAINRIKYKQGKEQEEQFGLKFTNYSAFYLIKNRYGSSYESFIMKFNSEKGLYEPAKREDAFIERNNYKYSEEEIKLSEINTSEIPFA